MGIAVVRKSRERTGVSPGLSRLPGVLGKRLRFPSLNDFACRFFARLVYRSNAKPLRLPIASMGCTKFRCTATVPSGRSAQYFSQGRMSTTIARLDLQTGHQDELISSLVPGYSDTWALSPRGIFFLGLEHSRPAIRFFDFATEGEKHIADSPEDLPQVEMSGFGVSHDGKNLWVVRADPMPLNVEITSFRSN